MTLADLIRQYLEDRRKHYIRKKCPSEEDSFISSIRDDNDDGLVTIDNKQYFSNNIDPKKNRINPSPQGPFTRQIGVSKSRRVINLPDGSIQIETIIRDSNGNEEKRITTRKGDKKHTIVTRKDATGVEQTDEKVTDVNDFEEFGFNSSTSLFGSDTSNDVVNESDFWLSKFFKPGNSPSNEDTFIREHFPFDFKANTDDQIERMLKKIPREQFFDSLLDVFSKSNPPAKNNEDFREVPDFNDFPKIDSSLLNDETRKLIENFERSASSPNISTKKNRGSSNQMETFLKGLTPPLPKSLFEQFAENAIIEIPDEKTPLDHFIQPDEDRMKSIRQVQLERDDAIKKLDKYFSSTFDTRAEDVYSDIDDQKNVDSSLVLPRPESSVIPGDFGEIFRKTFDRNSFSGSSQTRMFVENGKKRIESVQRNDQGLAQKTVCYEIGNLKYNVLIVTDKFGKVIKKEKNFNFPEEELPNFRNQWNRNFQSDFED